MQLKTKTKTTEQKPDQTRSRTVAAAKGMMGNPML